MAKATKSSGKLNKKNPNWKQDNPIDQLIVIRNAIEGHFDNWTNSVIDQDKFTSRLQAFFVELRELEPFLQGKERW